MRASRRSTGRGRGIRVQRRQFLIEAAADVLIARGRAAFRLEEVAERAGMSRRTVYNYFPTVRSLVIEGTAEMYGDLVENLRVLPSADASIIAEDAVLEDLISIMQRTDIVGVSIRTNHVFRGLPAEEVMSGALEVVAVLSEQLSAEFARRYPEDDAIETSLLIANVVSGLAVLLLRWNAEHGGAPAKQATRRWDQVQRRYIEHLRVGQSAFRPEPSPRRPDVAHRRGHHAWLSDHQRREASLRHRHG